MIRKISKVCGVTNLPDNSEDHLINVTKDGGGAGGEGSVLADNADLFNPLHLLRESGGDLTQMEAVDGATESHEEEDDLVANDDSDEECAANGL